MTGISTRQGIDSFARVNHCNARVAEKILLIESEQVSNAMTMHSGDQPRIVHFTDGIPTMRGYEHCEYADEFRRQLEEWAQS